MPFLNLNDPNILPWLVPVGPLVAFLIIVLFTNRATMVPATDPAYGGHHPDYDGILVPVVTPLSRVLSITVALSGLVMAWMISWRLFFTATALEGFGRTVFGSFIPWLATGVTSFNMGVLVDPLSATLLFMVPLAATMIFIYAIGYMANDPRQARFFALLSLFAGAMLTLVVADNLLLLFVGWEVMGLCSYLLIGFWYEKHSAYRAAIKAFTTTRIADVLMLLGIVYLYFSTGTLSFREILYNQAVLDGLAATPAIIFGGAGLSAAGLIGIFLVIGTIGKSAQFPLHVWLPDAMEGPTPVSAMIHAAAMVSAGVYAVIRMYPLFEAGGDPHHGVLTAPLMLMAIVGGITALFAAIIAVAQNDVKRVLAYSTISQLGFMVAALGVGAYVAAAFHLITHAFFKALLFMAAGAVIHGMEHGEHHVHAHGHAHGHDPHDAQHAHDAVDDAALHTETAAIGDEAGAHPPADDHAHIEKPSEHPHEQHIPHFDPQDMRNMGGLRHTMPWTFWTFLLGGLSLAGFPLITAGFWSKDEILAEAWLGLTEGFGPHAFVFMMLALAAFLTAFYTMRQLALTFAGQPRTEEAAHSGLGGGIPNLAMVLPLVVLAFFAVTAGFVGVHPDFPVFGWLFSRAGNPFFNFVGYTLVHVPPKVAFNFIPVLVSFAVALGGLGLGYVVYWRRPLRAGEEDPLVARLGALYPAIQNKFYFDELYQLVFVRPTQTFSRVVVSEFIDKGIIDGSLHLTARVFTFAGDLLKVLNAWLIDGVGDGIPRAIGVFGSWFRRVQTGRVQQYLLLVLVAVIMLGLIFALTTGLLTATAAGL